MVRMKSPKCVKRSVNVTRLTWRRRMWAQAAPDQKLGTLLRMHEAAFREWGSIPEEILYDRMKTVWAG